LSDTLAKCLTRDYLVSRNIFQIGYRKNKRTACESCGFTLDVGSQAVPCQKCGALLSFPVSVNHVVCPYYIQYGYAAGVAVFKAGCSEI
jgi:hypothetical protein